MFRRTHLLIALAGVLACPAFASAMSTMVLWECQHFGSDCNTAIPDDGTVTSSIIVPDTLPGCTGGFFTGVLDLDVQIEITHTWRSDLDVFLTHMPTGTTVELFTDVDSSGDDFDVTLDDEASTLITAGPCGNSGMACTGTFQPEGGLGDFDGEDPAGEWRLEITDDAVIDTGALVSWSLRMTLPDEDGDGLPNCYDPCPAESNLADADGDGVEDCLDNCPADPNKLDPGDCGCGNPDTDTDGDGIADCNDPCPADVDTDGDGVDDCDDNCPTDPNKLDPGECGCGNPDTDTDGDGIADCNDNCPNDATKLDPGLCGCGTVDVDSDGDGIFDCVDNCPADPNPDQADENSDGVGDVCTPPPAGAPNPCATGGVMTAPMTLLGIGWMRRRRRRRRTRI